MSLPAAASLTKGSRYWIAVMGHGGILKVRTNSPGKGTDNSETHRTLGGGQLPTTWRTGTVYRNDAPLSAYAVEKYSVLVFTKNASGNVAEGVAGLRALADAQEVTFDVTDDAGKFTAANLAKYRAVVFLNNTGDVLDGDQQTAFEDYFRTGGGFIGIHSAIEAEPDWQFMSDVLGTRAGTKTDPLEATIKVADRGHLASKGLPEYWTRTDRWYNFTGNVRGFSHVLATVDENTYTGGTNGFDHPIAWCKDYQGGRSFYTGGGGTADTFSEAGFRKHLAGALDWAAGKADKVYSDCGATVLANFQQTKVSAPPNINEPIGIDQLPDGRLLQTVRDGRLRLHDPVAGTSTVIATIPVYTQQRGRAVRAGGRRRLRHQPLGLPVLRPGQHGRALGQRLAVPGADAERERSDRSVGRSERVGPVEGLLPALALQVRRRAQPDAGHGERAEDHAGRGQSRRVLPRRR